MLARVRPRAANSPPGVRAPAHAGGASNRGARAVAHQECV
jgi:hypothetical protein